MGYAEWGFDLETIKKEKVKEIVPNEFNELDALILGDWYTFARSIYSDETGPDDCYFSEIIADIEDSDEDREIDALGYYEDIMFVWSNLVKNFEERTNARLNLFATTADLGRCDIADGDCEFIIDNLYILNEEIDFVAIGDVIRKNVVQGG